MRYKVQVNIVPDNAVSKGEFVHIAPLSEWVDADSHLEAAALFILDNPDVSCSTVWVVDEDYQMGTYPLDHVKLRADFVVGTRWFEDLPEKFKE